MELVLERAQSATGAAAAVVELSEGEEMVYHVVRGTAADHLGLRLSAATSLSGLCVRQGQVLHCDDAAQDDRVDLEACRRVGAMSMVCVPLSHSGQVVGALKVYDPAPAAFDAGDVETLELLSGVIAAHMAGSADFEAREHESMHDVLTGLANRRAFDERLAEEVARVTRHGGELALCLLDLDKFKQVNDTEGHPAGDAVLRAVADKLSLVRREDTAYRLGGDEFALILAEASDYGALAVAARIQKAIEEDGRCRGVSASFGIAMFQPGDDTLALMARADIALYDAKRTRVS
jgi:diguanylate cyclase (GGDEF)-like protein